MQEEILAGNGALPPPVVVFGHASTLTDAAVQTDFQLQTELPSPGRITQAPPDATFGDSPHKQRGQRQRHYAVIRAKLEHMVTSLSERRELADANAAAESHKSYGRPRTHKDDVQEANARLP